MGCTVRRTRSAVERCANYMAAEDGSSASCSADKTLHLAERPCSDFPPQPQPQPAGLGRLPALRQQRESQPTSDVQRHADHDSNKEKELFAF